MAAVAAWAASTAFSVGDIRRATTSQASGLWFRCTTAGTSAATEPSWPTDIGSTITDNTVVWTAISSVYEDVSVLAPSAIIELFELHLDSTLHGSSDVYRFHAGSNANVTGNIVFDGNAYTRFPVQADGFEMRSGGTLPQPTLSIANLDGTMTTLLALVNATTTGNDLTGATVKRIRTLKRYLDGESTADPNARFPTRVASQLGFKAEQYAAGLLSPVIGNTYAGAMLVGLSAVLDVAQPGQRVLTVSYGSGAGSDAFVWTVGEAIERGQDLAPRTQDYIARRELIDYGMYVRYRKKLYAH